MSVPTAAVIVAPCATMPQFAAVPGLTFPIVLPPFGSGEISEVTVGPVEVRQFITAVFAELPALKKKPTLRQPPVESFAPITDAEAVSASAPLDGVRKLIADQVPPFEGSPTTLSVAEPPL